MAALLSAGDGGLAGNSAQAGLQGHPAVFLPSEGDGQAIFLQSGLHLGGAGVDDARAQEGAVLRQKAERFSTVIDPAQIAEVALGCQA